MGFDACFESLAPEIHAAILCQIPDLDSLDAVLRASPAAWRVFDRYGVNIMERVLNAGYIHHNSCTIIRVIAAIRLNCFPVVSISDLQRRVTYESLLHGQTFKCPVADKFTPSELPKTSTSKVMRSIIHTARRISFLTLGCLDSCLQRFSKSFGNGLVSYEPTCPDNPERVLDPAYVVGHPIWREEQILYRGFWRIQLVQDLKKALKDGNMTGWVNHEIETLNSMSMEDIYQFTEADREVSLFESVAGYVSPFPMGCQTTEHNAVLSAERYMEEKDGSVLTPSSSWTRPWPVPPLLVKDVKDLEHRYGDLEAAGTLGIYICEAAFRHCPEKVKPSFTLYRQLGFAIWTRERLIGHGFSPRVHEGNRNRSLLLDSLPFGEAAKIIEWNQGWIWGIE